MGFTSEKILTIISVEFSSVGMTSQYIVLFCLTLILSFCDFDCFIYYYMTLSSVGNVCTKHVPICASVDNMKFGLFFYSYFTIKKFCIHVSHKQTIKMISQRGILG